MAVFLFASLRTKGNTKVPATNAYTNILESSVNAGKRDQRGCGSLVVERFEPQSRLTTVLFHGAFMGGVPCFL